MTHIEEMVSRQVALFELQQRLEKEGQVRPHVRVEEVAYGPSLLVSREWGSGGRELAGLVSRRLDWQVFDREIVDEIARRTHMRRRLIESVDERVRSKWTKSLGWLAHGTGITRDEYLSQLREIILTLGHHGNVVIMGRGAQYLLPSQAAVRVRVVAPIEAREQRVAEREKISPAQARHHIEKRDAERAEFIQRAFSADSRSPLAYDLVLNTGEIGIEMAAGIVLAALNQKLGVQAESLTAANA